MKKQLLKYLCCPSCEKDLQLTNCNIEDEINNGTLRCIYCKASYPILYGVPVFTKPDINLKKKITAQNFAYSWQTFPTLNKNFYWQQFLDWIKPIDEKFLAGKFVLDAGCGKGHHLLMISPYVKEAIGIDISNSVFTVYNNIKHLSNIHVIKADLNFLPLKDGIFDYIYSIGVVHHTESPKRTVENLHKKINKNGSMSLWVYGRENNGWIIYFINPLRKIITTYFHPRIIYMISIVLALFLYPILKLFYLPVSKSKILNPISKILFYYPYLSYISAFDFSEINNIIFDHLLAPISHYLSKKEVEDLAKLSSAKPTIEWHNQNSWRIQINT